MKRRLFVKTSLLSAAVANIIPLKNAAAMKSSFKNANQEFYELRVYTFTSIAQQKITEDYFEKAAIPALNRLGSKSIGVFKELKPLDQIRLYIIIPYKSVTDFEQAGDKLLKDDVYKEAGAAYLNATAAAPAYERIESSLLKAFAHMPALVPPEKNRRMFELRRYESATELAGKKKIEMFNDKGEIDIFKRIGFSPVFFGETIIGILRPNLTYMLSLSDLDSHQKNWKTFGSDPEWKKISSMPDYADAKIVSHITSIFLVAATCSQV